MTQPSFTRRLLGEDGRPIALLLVYGDEADAYELLRAITYLTEGGQSPSLARHTGDSTSPFLSGRRGLASLTIEAHAALRYPAQIPHDLETASKKGEASQRGAAAGEAGGRRVSDTRAPSIPRVRSLLIKAGLIPCRYGEGRQPISTGFLIWKSQYRNAFGPRFIAVRWVFADASDMPDDEFAAEERRQLESYRDAIKAAGIEVYVMHKLAWVPLPAQQEHER